MHVVVPKSPRTFGRHALETRPAFANRANIFLLEQDQLQTLTFSTTLR
jgi:hypothetical protein